MLLYMIRHGRTDWNRDRRIMGREPVPLNKEGTSMVETLAEFLAGDRIEKIYSGTLQRVVQTSGILARKWGVEVLSEPSLDESTYDKWVGQFYRDLKDDPDFILYNEAPTRSSFSDGEDMTGVQDRALEAVGRIVSGNVNGRVALVSHSDVIKPVIAHYLSMPLDSMHRLGVANASVTLLDTEGPAGPRLRYMNLMPWKWDGKGERA